jgi:hypothetical protein
MTLELRPDTEARLLRVAHQQGRDPADVINDILVAALGWEEIDQDEIDLLNRRNREADEGRERSLDAFLREHCQRYPDPS